jgi:hypothetical protein
MHRSSVCVEIRRQAVAAVIALALVLAAAPAGAQKITGTPGSPSATTTIDGRQLPPPPQRFGGKI